MGEVDVKERVRRFYDQVGWQLVGQGQYQNARYEDLRPVAREYIHKCHLRVKRHLKPTGRFLLDAGSGPVQYAEYLTFSEGYDYRVCADISIVALQEARKRLGQHGLYVVADVANLPFKSNAFDGVVSLHTLHHLPLEDQWPAYRGIYRSLAPGSQAVVVNGWTESALMNRWKWLENAMAWLGKLVNSLRHPAKAKPVTEKADSYGGPAAKDPTGTFVEKLNAGRLRQELADLDVDILVWRSISVRFSRAVFHTALGGRYWLRLLYRLEERFPHYYGEKGQYPLIVVRKP